MKTLGPFDSLYKYHYAEIQLILDLIHLFLLDILLRVTKTVNSTMLGSRSCFLKHPDDKGDHILVDDDFNITAAIDWEWAYTAPPALAFNSPIMLFDLGHFYDGSNALSADEEMLAKILEEKGRFDLAVYLKHGRTHHRTAFCCGYDLSDWDGFLGLFRGLRRALDIDTDLE